MAKRKRKDKGTVPEIQLEAIVATISEEDMIEAGWVFLKMKGDKKVYVKDTVRKQI